LKATQRRFAFGAGVIVLAAVLAMTLTACGGGGGGSTSSASAKPIACEDLTELRDLAPQLKQFTNRRTGDSVDYLVMGDAAISDDVVVMFNGTGGILPDWPLQLITNSQYSPNIVSTDAYDPLQDGTISICHDYRLVMFDYPGVGNSPLTGNVTYDDIANDVDAMLDEIGRRYHIPTNKVDLMGWSLGSAEALKYASVAPTANPRRKIGNLLLIATKPGGNTDGFVDGNEAACVMTLFDELKNNPNLDDSFKKELEEDLYQLTFPYVGQPPNTGASSGCTATIIDDSSIYLNVTLNCPLDSECDRNLVVEEANRATSPWSITKGTDYNLFVQQRELADDLSLCYCGAAGRNFTSTNCSCSGAAPEMSATNGGVCQTVSPQPNTPMSTNCVKLDISGKINVINGPEDLLIQYVYGQALVTGYQQMFGNDAATIATYPGAEGAGHGVMLQHPLWTQQQLFQGLSQ
jgi:pimeloyl-ACP methyl ester carboxylesterase